MMTGWLAAVATIGGASCLYASAPHQALVARGVAPRPWRIAGMALLAAALCLLLTAQGPATAVFTWMTGMMLVWTTVPVVARWRRFRKDAAR